MLKVERLSLLDYEANNTAVIASNIARLVLTALNIFNLVRALLIDLNFYLHYLLGSAHLNLAAGVPAFSLEG